MEQSPSGEFKMSSANQKILHILRNPEYHFRITSAATCPYPEPDQSIPCLPISLLQEYFNIILPLMRRFSKWSLSTTSLHPKPYMHLNCFQYVSHSPPITFFLIYSLEYLVRNTQNTIEFLGPQGTFYLST